MHSYSNRHAHHTLVKAGQVQDALSTAHESPEVFLSNPPG